MIELDGAEKTPMYEQIYRHIRDEIVSGELAAGSKLTSSRALADKLHVSRNTVNNAYWQLALEGYITCVPRSGYVVENVYKGVRTNGEETPPQPPAPAPPPAPPQPSPDPERIRYNFHYGWLNPEGFPALTWRKCCDEALLSYDVREVARYGDKRGHLALRQALLTHLEESRGVRCRPEQILLCNTINYSLDIIAKLLAEETQTLAIEDPGFSGAAHVFANNGYQIAPIPLEADGINIQKLSESPAKVVFITPSHQFPLGMIMPVNKRLRLLDWAREKGGYVIEDDYDSDFRYHSRPIASLQSIDQGEQVIYLGTFSKGLAPGLHICYLILPPQLLERYLRLFALYHESVSWLQQKALLTFIEKGHWKRHLRRSALQNQRLHDLMIHEISRRFGPEVILHGRNAGLHLVLEFPPAVEEEWLIRQAASRGVKVYSIAKYCLAPQTRIHNMILLGFSSLCAEDISQGIALLAQAWLPLPTEPPPGTGASGS